MGNSASTRLDPYLRIHAVNVYVRDQDESLRFYLEQLGFVLAFDAKLQSGERWVAVAPPDGTAVLALVAPKPDSPAYQLIGRPTSIVFVTEDVPAKYREWRQRGVHFSHTPRLRRVHFGAGSGEHKDEPVWGGVFTRFRDLDGNSFTLAGFDEVTRELEAQRRAEAERRDRELRVAQELEIAKQVQARLFPQRQPKLRTLEYAGVCVQARQVGGDYYDYIELGQDRLGLVIGDISGKGIAAALLMANLQANLRSQCATAVDEPGRFLQSVNRLFLENTTDASYATLFFAEYDDRSRRLRYANCGHLPALIVRADGSCQRLEPTTTVLGIFLEWECPVGGCQLEEGDTLALYTDGITESFSEAGEDFGEARLMQALQRSRGLATGAMLGAVIEEVQRFSGREQRDDVTLVVARCHGQ
ncbi:MAG TPA: SpoIIE family protein phosphatase [Bryobacteraceae bacterium]|nr:SpoIIE family protein phosphatase [Bryobacteraceae bacterium]